MLDVAQQSELDGGPRKSVTERYCALTREVKPVTEMIRFVAGPDGVVPDVKQKLPGRGLWITATRESVADAVKSKTFARAFKRDVRVPADLADMTERLLTRATLDALSIAGKAGNIAAGFAKTDAALTHDAMAGLITAADAAPDGAGKLKSALRARPDADKIAVITGFSTAQLDLALARSNVVHAALLAGPASETFLARYARLERFRAGEKGAADRRATSLS